MASASRRCCAASAARPGRTDPRGRGTGAPAGRAADVPSPALLAVDPDGAQAGVPALLMGCRPGRLVALGPGPLAGAASRAAAAYPGTRAGHTVPASPPTGRNRPPGWARYPRVWERAVEISRDPAPPPAVLLHRDFHPGNVLWRYGRVSGVVDWLGACSGPAPADVAHCRLNLLTMGTEVASRFTVSLGTSGRRDVPPVGQRGHRRRLPRRPARRRLGLGATPGRGHARPGHGRTGRVRSLSCPVPPW